MKNKELFCFEISCTVLDYFLFCYIFILSFRILILSDVSCVQRFSTVLIYHVEKFYFPENKFSISAKRLNFTEAYLAGR